MAVKIELKRSAVPTKVPTTSSLDLGELALNTYDGRAFMKQQQGTTESIVEFATTSGTGSRVLSASYSVSASYAVTSSYPLGGVVTASAVNTTITFTRGDQSTFSVTVAQSGSVVTASYAIFAATSSLANLAQTASNSITASYAISASQAQTASYIAQTATASIAISASYALTSSYSLSGIGFPFTGSAQITGSLLVSGSLILTGSMQISGSITASLFGSASYATSASAAQQAQTASYILNAVSASYSLTSSFAQTASFVTTAQTASYVVYAQTSSHADSFTIGGSLINYSLVPSTIAGNNGIFATNTGSFSSAFYQYTVYKGENARSNNTIAVWTPTTQSFTNYSTIDIGSTVGVEASVVFVGDQVQLNLQTPTPGWTVKAMVTFL